MRGPEFRVKSCALIALQIQTTGETVSRLGLFMTVVIRLARDSCRLLTSVVSATGNMDWHVHV